MDELDGLPSELPPPAPAEKEPRVTQAEILLKLVAGTGADFFHSDTNDLYAAIPVTGHTEVWPLDGKDFSTWLCRLYYNETERPVNSEAVGQTVAVLSAKARFDNPDPITLSTRSAEGKTKTGNMVIWYDLTNSAWQSIRITADGWNMIDNPPILFNRYRHVIGLPGIHIECKRVERLNLYDAMAQAIHDTRPEELPTVFSRRNHADWLVTMRLEDWVLLYREWEATQ